MSAILEIKLSLDQLEALAAMIAAKINSSTGNPRWMTFSTAAKYSGLSVGTLQNYEKSGAIRVSNVIQPGCTRGRKLVDRKSLDAFIEANIGTITSAISTPPRRRMATRRRQPLA